MASVTAVPAREYVPTADQRLVTYNVPWSHYEAQRALRGDAPDLVIEVVWTSGGLDKLEIYRRLGVPEVWFWRDGRIVVHVLQEGEHELADRSPLVPDLDLELICALVDRPTALQAVRALREHLRS